MKEHSLMRIATRSLVSAAAVILLASSCQKAEETPAGPDLRDLTLTATVENGGSISLEGGTNSPETKTIRNSNGTVWWTPGDAISLFYGSGTDGGSKFTNTATENVASAQFTGSIGVITAGNESSVEAYSFWGVYPYSSDNSCSGSYVTLTVPSEQESSEGTFAPGQWPAVGKATALAMSFKNVCCGYKFMVETPGITSLKVTAGSGALSGKIDVSMDSSGNPQITPAGSNASTVIVRPKDSETFKTGVYYYVTMIHNPSYTEGITWTFYRGAQCATYICDMSGDKKEYPSARNKFKVMDNKDSGLTWEDSTPPDILPDGDTFRNYMIQLAGTLNNITRIDFCVNSTATDGTEITDDVYMSYSGGVITVSTSHSQFTANKDCSCMFDGCRNVTAINGLQYVNTSGTTDMGWMFEYCNELKSLDLGGYFTTANVTSMCDMFYGCEKLEELDLSTWNTRKVTTMGYMFKRCSALKKVILGENFVIPYGCFADEMLLGCDATFYGTTEEMESFQENLFSGYDYFSGTLHFAIDMGGAGWWSAWNAGAEKPTELGYAFHWYNDDGKGSGGYLIYEDTPNHSITVDWDSVPGFDDQWRMPDKNDFENLLTCCDAIRTVDGAYCAYKFTNKNNGNYIILPPHWDPGVNYLITEFYGNEYRINFSPYNMDFYEARGATSRIRPIAKLGDVAVTGVSLDKTSITVTSGETAQLTAAVTPSNANAKYVTWSSSDTSVAVVTATSGTTAKIIGVSSGTATITATSVNGSKTATSTVTVNALSLDALSGNFSVSNSKKVKFSSGNLQALYNGSKYEWGFAKNQYDYVGHAPGNSTIDSQTVGSIVDLFGWSTDATYYGISTSTSVSDYSGDFVDWGTAIDNKGTWHTLSKDEWEYLRSRRTNAKNLYKCGVTVCGKTNCLIIAPDGFTGTIADSYDATSWPAAETAGLVCLPPAGDRYSWGTQNDGIHGNYWTPDHASDSYSSFICVESDSFSTIFYEQRFYGLSVRLITDVK